MKKWAVIRKSDANPEGLERKRLKDVIKELKSYGYEVFNELK